jgi:dihydrolipoamide dehydrogenase
VVTGVGRFVSPHELEVESSDGKKLVRFAHAIIAAGSQAVKLPGLPWDDKRLMDSTDALDLTDVPKRLLVVGGGIIGLEMACVYDALGTEVTVVELLDQLMPGADPDLVRPLEQRLKKRYGGGIHLKVKVARIEAEKKGLKASFEGEKAPEPQLYDRVLVAVGRSPNGKKVGAESAGVNVTERGFIPVDKQMRTNVPHIFAIGDVVGNPMLAHKATHEGKVAAEVIAGREERVRRARDSVGGLHRSGNRLGGRDRSRSQGAGAEVRHRQVPVCGVRPCHRHWPHRGLHQAGVRRGQSPRHRCRHRGAERG